MKLRVVFETVEQDAGAYFRRPAGELEISVHDDEQLELLAVFADEVSSEPIVVVPFTLEDRWVPAHLAHAAAFYDSPEGQLFSEAVDEELDRRRNELERRAL